MCVFTEAVKKQVKAGLPFFSFFFFFQQPANPELLTLGGKLYCLEEIKILLFSPFCFISMSANLETESFSLDNLVLGNLEP